MPTVIFKPVGARFEVAPDTKLLVAATRNKVKIRFGCASCRCGTCGVAVAGDATLSKMRPDEHALLARMGLPTDGSVRLACQTRVQSGAVEIDLDFQDSYSPDDFEDGEDDGGGDQVGED